MIEARALPMGDAAVLIEVANLASVVALQAAVAEQVNDRGGSPDHSEAPHEVWTQVEDVIPAARTILLRVGVGTDLPALGRAAVDLAGRTTAPARLAEVSPGAGDPPEAEVHEIGVTYAGADLADIADATGLSQAEVVEAHTGSLWTVAFFGFAPGFAYLAGGDPRLGVPRRSEPRTAVPPGSVGLAGEFSAVYPRESPGGWQLLGHTDTVMWDVDRDPASLLQPGERVRFVDRGGRS